MDADHGAQLGFVGYGASSLLPQVVFLSFRLLRLLYRSRFELDPRSIKQRLDQPSESSRSGRTAWRQGKAAGLSPCT